MNDLNEDIYSNKTSLKGQPDYNYKHVGGAGANFVYFQTCFTSGTLFFKKYLQII